MSDANWSPAMARQDISDQTEEANQAARDEVMQQRHTDAHLIPDDQPTAAEQDEQYWVYEQRAREWWSD